ncbi:MAG: hypothetical protein JO129_02710 [Candidatus Dependentiae bacterium]|nr:hypothetical protein [Candidatus Dependentiae bacterium]
MKYLFFIILLIGQTTFASESQSKKENERLQRYFHCTQCVLKQKNINSAHEMREALYGCSIEYKQDQLQTEVAKIFNKLFKMNCPDKNEKE